jgi:hypothetical protein
MLTHYRSLLVFCRYGLDPWAVKTRLDAGDADLAKQVQDLHLTYAAGKLESACPKRRP